jgi:hypothetical protein
MGGRTHRTWPRYPASRLWPPPWWYTCAGERKHSSEGRVGRALVEGVDSSSAAGVTSANRDMGEIVGELRDGGAGQLEQDVGSGPSHAQRWQFLQKEEGCGAHIFLIAPGFVQVGVGTELGTVVWGVVLLLLDQADGRAHGEEGARCAAHRMSLPLLPPGALVVEMVI